MFKSFLSKALLVILMGAGMCTVERLQPKAS